MQALKQSAVDVYDEVYAYQTLGGDLGLYDVHSGQLQAHTAFPAAEEARPHRGATASPSLKWLGAPDGGVWDLANGQMIFHLRPFQTGAFDGDETFYADFPAFRDTPRTMVKINLARRAFTPVPIYAAPDMRYRWVEKPHQTTRLQALLSPCHLKYPDFDPLDCNVTVQVEDLQSGRVLWSRHFEKEFPRHQVDLKQARVILGWAASDAAVAHEIQKYPKLAEPWATVRNHAGAAFIEILNLSDGSVRHAMFLDSGALTGLHTVGERLLVSHRGYIEVFSLTNGHKEGDIPGWLRAASPTGNLLSVGTDAPNELEIYDLQSLRRLDHFAFSAYVYFEQFSGDDKRLLVLTSDETAYFLDTTALPSTDSRRQ